MGNNSDSFEDVIDLEAFQQVGELAGEEDPEFVRLLVEKFIDSTQSKLDSFASLLDSEHFESLSREFHSIKPNAYLLGANKLGDLALKFETLFKEKPSKDVPLNEFSEEFHRVVKALELLLKEHHSAA